MTIFSSLGFGGAVWGAMQPDRHNKVAKKYEIVTLIPYNMYMENGCFLKKKPFYF